MASWAIYTADGIAGHDATAPRTDNVLHASANDPTGALKDFLLWNVLVLNSLSFVVEESAMHQMHNCT